jgi:hypothetical protein
MFMNVNEINFLFAVERRSFHFCCRTGVRGSSILPFEKKKNLRSTTETREVQGEPRQLRHHLSGAVKTRLNRPS